MALHYYKSGKNYLADPASTVKQLSVGYYCKSKNLIAVLDKIRTKFNLGDNDKWKKETKKLFKKREKKEPTAGENENGALVETENNKGNDVKSNSKSQKKTQSGESVPKPKKQKNAKTKFDEGDDEVNPTEAPTTVDDFFITSDGTNYMSNAVVATIQKDDDDSESAQQPKKRPSDFGKNVKSRIDGGKKFDKGPAGEKRKWNEESNEQTDVKQERTIDPNLHPSWIAKQKQKPTITEFKGSKITFD